MVLPQENPSLRKEISQKEILKSAKENQFMEEIEYSLSKIMKEHEKLFLLFIIVFFFKGNFDMFGFRRDQNQN